VVTLSDCFRPMKLIRPRFLSSPIPFPTSRRSLQYYQSSYIGGIEARFTNPLLKDDVGAIIIFVLDSAAIFLVHSARGAIKALDERVSSSFLPDIHLEMMACRYQSQHAFIPSGLFILYVRVCVYLFATSSTRPKRVSA
jgi:hypothetical protein